MHTYTVFISLTLFLLSLVIGDDERVKGETSSRRK